MKTIAALLILTLATPAQAWNQPGHMVIGAIAYERLPPETRAKVAAMLRKHPHYESRWQLQLAGFSAAEQDKYLFMLAARWPDDIRGDANYHRAKIHYINLPFRPDGQQAKGPDRENILTGYREQIETLKTGTDAEKAIALCWLFHLVGDVHQPLHTVGLITADYPQGDMGGNLFFIRKHAGQETESLHAFWDNLIIPRGTDDFDSVSQRAGEIEHVEAGGDFRAWAEESYRLAVEVAYRKGELRGSTDRMDGLALPRGYAVEARKVAERRIAEAGVRLAGLLGGFNLAD